MKYKITYSDEAKFIWFQVNKVASSSLYRVISKNTKLVSDESRSRLRAKHEHYIARRKNNFLKSRGSYFSFMFVRNPWERLVSHYTSGFSGIDKANINKLTESGRFIDYLKLITNPKRIPQNPHWSPQVLCGPVNCLSFIGRFENLQEDFNVICDEIGIPYEELPCENKSKHKHYTEYYDDETRQIVAEKYAQDIEIFGYKFGAGKC